MFLCFSPSRVSSQSSQASIHTVVYLSSMLCPRSAQGGGMSWRLSSRIVRLLLGTESLQEYQHQYPFIFQLQVLQDWLSGYHHHSCVINLLWIWVYYGQLLNSKCLGTGIRGSSVSCTSQDLILRRQQKPASDYINTYLDHLTLKLLCKMPFYVPLWTWEQRYIISFIHFTERNEFWLDNKS